MKIEARLFFDVYKIYDKVSAADIKGFMTGKDYETMKTQIKSQISTMQEGNATAFISTTEKKSKTIMRQVINSDEVETTISDWADSKAYEKLFDDCLECIYDKLAGVKV
jgi:hypothetical protein